jgi:hypothetical protein
MTSGRAALPYSGGRTGSPTRSADNPAVSLPEPGRGGAVGGTRHRPCQDARLR